MNVIDKTFKFDNKACFDRYMTSYVVGVDVRLS